MADAGIDRIETDDGVVCVWWTEKDGSRRAVTVGIDVAADVADAIRAGYERAEEREAVRHAQDWRSSNGNEPPPKLEG